jgi:hypothetical protein
VKRDVLLHKLVEPSPSGRVHDMECDCVKWYCSPEDGWFSQAFNGCHICHGTGRVSKRLSRREAHAIVTFSRMCDKAYRRTMQHAVQQRRLEDRAWWRKNIGDIKEWRW